jgi:hypothetical protein
MFARRAFAVLLGLALVFLALLSAARRIERERRLLARLRDADALSPQQALPVSALSADERDTLRALMEAGVAHTLDRPGRRGARGIRARQGCYVDPRALRDLRRKRARLALSGVLVLVLAAAVAVLALRR